MVPLWRIGHHNLKITTVTVWKTALWRKEINNMIIFYSYKIVLARRCSKQQNWREPSEMKL